MKLLERRKVQNQVTTDKTQLNAGGVKLREKRKLQNQITEGLIKLNEHDKKKAAKVEPEKSTLDKFLNGDFNNLSQELFRKKLIEIEAAANDENFEKIRAVVNGFAQTLESPKKKVI